MLPADTPPPAPPRRKRSARFIEIAQAAGVSTATVNRVLNEQGSVAAATRERVVAAARQLGVPRVLPDLRHGLTRIDLILARSPTPFLRRLEAAVQQAAQLLDRRIVVHRHVLDAADDEKIARAILQPPQRRDGLAIAVRDTPRLREALRGVIAQGLPVVTLMSDIGEVPRLHYAGIDNLRAGRCAGHFVGQLIGQAGAAAAGLAVRPPGRVLVLSNSLAYRAHADRCAGCRAVIAERFAHLRCSQPVECFDEPDRCYQAVAAALKSGDGPLLGIYHSGAGAAGIAAALAQAPQRVVWVGHELSDEHRTLIAAGSLDLVIDQDPDRQATVALQHLLHASGWLDEAPSQAPTEFRLFCAENLPPPAGPTPTVLSAPPDRPADGWAGRAAPAGRPAR